jgi:hypothetical protein
VRSGVTARGVRRRPSPSSSSPPIRASSSGTSTAFPEDAYNRLVPVATLQLPTDLLRPVVQVVQLNPDPKNGGDVYTSHDTPAGPRRADEGRAAQARDGGRDLFVDERRTDDGSNPDVIEVT